mgnify:CR=1 FL=1
MARIAGVDIPRDKRVVVSLTYIYGIGLPTSKQILKEFCKKQNWFHGFMFLFRI